MRLCGNENLPTGERGKGTSSIPATQFTKVIPPIIFFFIAPTAGDIFDKVYQKYQLAELEKVIYCSKIIGCNQIDE